MARVTICLDDDVWSKFRSSVFEKHGSLKVLSKEVEQSLKHALQEGEVLAYLARLRRAGGPKKRVRPRLRDRRQRWTCARRGVGASKVYLDTSALVSRYVTEPGTPSVDHVFDRPREKRQIGIIFSAWNIGELLGTLD